MLFFERLAQLERDHASFAVATVVARRSPVSSHLGDRALIFPDGHMEGFVGGSCSRDIVRRHAVGVIRSRQPVLLQIRPDSRDAAESSSNEAADIQADLVVIPMSCSSEGAVDVYIEPRVPLRRLVIVGFTPVAEALAQVAVALDYAVVRVMIEDELRDLGLRPRTIEAERIHARHEPEEPVSSDAARRGARIVELKGLRAFLAGLDADTERDLIAVVASQGHYDELALEVLLERPIAFTGLLASRRRAETVAGVLSQQGLPADRIAAIHNPVGLDIGARSPGEVAISILAQIIAHDKIVAVVGPRETLEHQGAVKAMHTNASVHDRRSTTAPAGGSGDRHNVATGPFAGDGGGSPDQASAPRPLQMIDSCPQTLNADVAGESAQRPLTMAQGATAAPPFAGEGFRVSPKADSDSPNVAFGTIEVDPVCGMEVETGTALYRYEHSEQTYFFCGAHCRAKFSADLRHDPLPLGTA